MNAIINGMRCPPSFLILPEYEEYIFAKIPENTFVKVPTYTRSVTLSLIGGGAGGGCGGVRDPSSVDYNTRPGGASGGGSAYLETSKVGIDQLLASLGENWFASGFEYGLRVEVGAGGNGSGLANTPNGADGGASKVYFLKRNASTLQVVSEKLVLQNAKTAKGGYGGTGTYKGIKNVAGTRGGAGGYGGNGGGKGYSGSNSTDISVMPNPAYGESEYDINTKKYLFNDPNTKRILGQGGQGGGGFYYQYESWPARGPIPLAGESAYGAGGYGGNNVDMGYNLAGGPGTSGVIGIRIHYR